jgi:hypothetical protein
MPRPFATAILRGRIRRTPARPKREPSRVETTRCRRHKEECSHRARSPVRRPFQRLQQLLHVVVSEPGRKPQFSRSNREWFLPGPLRGHQSQTQKVIDHVFERSAGSPAFLLQESSDIIIQRKGGSHIMMLSSKASRCQRGNFPAGSGIRFPAQQQCAPNKPNRYIGNPCI